MSRILLHVCNIHMQIASLAMPLCNIILLHLQAVSKMTTFANMKEKIDT